MSKWYGLGGGWISIGLPIYVEINRKLVNGCKTQNSRDAIYQVMMQLKLVKYKAEEDRFTAEIRVDSAQQTPSVHLLHGTKVLINLVKPWRNKLRTVCDDSYFSSVPAIDKFEKIGLQFVGVVKTEKKYILCTS